MTISVFEDSTPPRFAHMLRKLDAILAKSQAHAAAKKIDPAVLLSARLFPVATTGNFRRLFRWTTSYAW